MIQRFLLFLLCCSFSQLSKSQDGIPYSQITQTENGKTTKAFIKTDLSKKYQLDEQLDYHYYYKNTFAYSQGNYTGYLLHGKIEVFNPAQQLIEKGQYQHGLKNGKWYHWHDNGKLAKLDHWKGGRLHGIQKIFDQDGQLLSSSEYKKGKLNGKVIVLVDGEVVSSDQYKKGELKVKKEKKKKEPKEKKEKKEKTKKEE